jgi:hypothetical protein
MKKLMRILVVLTTAGWAAVQQAPFATQDVSISSHKWTRNLGHRLAVSSPSRC